VIQLQMSKRPNAKKDKRLRNKENEKKFKKVTLKWKPWHKDKNAGPKMAAKDAEDQLFLQQLFGPQASAQDRVAELQRAAKAGQLTPA